MNSWFNPQSFTIAKKDRCEHILPFRNVRCDRKGTIDADGHQYCTKHYRSHYSQSAIIARRVRDTQRIMLMQASDLEASVAHIEELASARTRLARFERTIEGRLSQALTDLGAIADLRTQLANHTSTLQDLDFNDPQGGLFDDDDAEGPSESDLPSQSGDEVDDLLQRMNALMDE